LTATFPFRPTQNRSTVVAVAGLGAIVSFFTVLTHAANSWDYERWMVLVLAPLLFVIGAAIIAAVTRRDETRLTGLLLTALAVKMAASFVRYFVSFSLYGSGDSLRYDTIATEIANQFHRGESTLSSLLPVDQGTPFVDEFAGLIYAAMGPSRLGGFLVFSWIGFWGLFLFHRALLVGVPAADQRRYTMLVCFLPSLVFWPSSIGKEAVMMFSLGCCALGAARVIERRRGGWISLGAGLVVAYMVRPHVGVVVLAGLIVALMFRRRPGRSPVFGPVGRVVTVAVMVAVLAFVLGRAVDRLLPYQAQHATGIGAVGAVLDRAEAGTDDGGSQIDRPSPNNPLEYPKSSFTVLFRPTILEARSLSNVAAGLETTGLLACFVLGWRRLRTAASSAFHQPYILFCLVYTAVFTFAWSAFANLGALARQRVQVWPFLLILLALPLALGARDARPVQRFIPR